MIMYAALHTCLLVDYVISFRLVRCKLFTSVQFGSLLELFIKRCPEDNVFLVT